MSSFQLTGLTAAPVTPMDENGDVNYAQIEVLARLYEKNGLTGVFISGTTGEGPSLTHSEKKEILKDTTTNRNSTIVECFIDHQ